jgi:hypothetical protein
VLRATHRAGDTGATGDRRAGREREQDGGDGQRPDVEDRAVHEREDEEEQEST